MNKLIFGKSTLIMGVLNVTPDSFSDGGVFSSSKKAVARAEQMLDKGADIIDIGGESTRPGSEFVSEEEELGRVVPVISQIRKELGKEVLVSIDTYKSNVARYALESGANMVNSLGGFFFDKKMADVAAEFEAPILIYHIKGKPKDMQKNPVYKDVIHDIKKFFKDQIQFGLSKGLKRSQFFIDPGIGFGKTVSQNLEIIKRLDEFKSLELPICIGVSRKSHLGLVLQEDLDLKNVSASERLEASLAETAAAVINGAKIVRTHDVLETKKFLTVLDKVV
jgi:dihydropteroate synthase